MKIIKEPPQILQTNSKWFIGGKKRAKTDGKHTAHLYIWCHFFVTPLCKGEKWKLYQQNCQTLGFLFVFQVMLEGFLAETTKIDADLVTWPLIQTTKNVLTSLNQQIAMSCSPLERSATWRADSAFPSSCDIPCSFQGFWIWIYLKYLMSKRSPSSQKRLKWFVCSGWNATPLKGCIQNQTSL